MRSFCFVKTELASFRTIRIIGLAVSVSCGIGAINASVLMATPQFDAPLGSATPEMTPEMTEAMAKDPRAAALMEKAKMSALKAADGKPTPSQPGRPGSAPPGSNPPPPGPPGEGEKPGEGALKPVTRSAEPPEPPNPAELKVQANSDGLLEFQFRNQPWPDVVRWLASVSNLSLDWQELPGDYINLATQHPFTLDETTDMINRALLLRGFTLLENDGVLTVVKIADINPSMVPRVSPSELSNLPPNRFVRTSFPLTWLLAEDVNEEFASMISRNGKLVPLAATNRLEGMDAAANLSDIYDILQQEQSGIALENLAREFVLQYARASTVKSQLEQFLGLQSSSGAGGAGSSASSRDAMRMMQQQMQQQMQAQMQAQMQQQMQSRGGAKPPTGGSKPRSEDVYLVANDRNNSVIVHAQPDKMAIIESFISRVDVRNANSADYQRMQTRMKVYRLASLSPTELVASLSAMDVLEPMTQLQVDDSNNAIIAYASVADQYLIQSVIDRLDGSERSFEVVQLRRLEAESVAGSIKFLMGAEEEDSQSNTRRSYYDYYDYGRSSSRDDKKQDKMRVGANVQDNQVLLWANPIEMEEVRNLLVKLGELPPEGGRQSTIRVIDASRQPETYEYLKRLKEQWDRVSPNPLILPDANEFLPPEEADKAVDSSPEAPSSATEPPSEPADKTPTPEADSEPSPVEAPSVDKITFSQPGQN